MSSPALMVIGALFGLFVLLQIVARVVRRSAKSPAPPSVAFLLDSRLRRLVQPPAKVVERSKIAKGMQVLEVGCGSGAIALHAAGVVGPEGKIYALDVQAGMLKRFERKLAQSENRDISNVELIEADACDMPFEDASFDLVYMVTALPEMPDPQRALQEVKRVLKPGGILAVTELLFDPDYPLKSTSIKRCTQAGLVFDESAGNFLNYTVTFKKPEGDE